jgi:hypothetical protein
MNAIASYLKQFSKSGGAGVTTSSAGQFKATDILGDIHLLRYLAVNDIIPFSMVRKKASYSINRRFLTPIERMKEMF